MTEVYSFSDVYFKQTVAHIKLEWTYTVKFNDGSISVNSPRVIINRTVSFRFSQYRSTLVNKECPNKKNIFTLKICSGKKGHPDRTENTD